jgi:Na+-transporting methylmalonyl-CoA/oxaloacetate decarboxylase gamma subunit
MENIIFGLGVTALGMITVFSGLVILIMFLKLLGAFSGTGKKEKKQKAPAKAQPAKASDANEVPGEVMAAITAALAMNNEAASAEVVAAISAAITMVMGGEKFVVRHVKRISNAPAWNRAGREEQVYSRF